MKKTAVLLRMNFIILIAALFYFSSAATETLPFLKKLNTAAFNRQKFSLPPGSKAYMTVTSSKGIVGPDGVQRIEINSFEIDFGGIMRDAASGMTSGKRNQAIIMIEKFPDATTPIFIDFIGIESLTVKIEIVNPAKGMESKGDVILISEAIVDKLTETYSKEKGAIDLMKLISRKPIAMSMGR
jgi:hypothetical protein